MSSHLAEMSRWLLVTVEGSKSLFGFCTYHAQTGGLSWLRSSPIRMLDEATGRAITASGRIYKLGARITEDDLDEEGALAFEILVNGLDENTQVGDCGLSWLVARKISRHLRTPCPERDDCQAVERYLSDNYDFYMEARGILVGRYSLS